MINVEFFRDGYRVFETHCIIDNATDHYGKLKNDRESAKI
jgi:hypothetical protein